MATAGKSLKSNDFPHVSAANHYVSGVISGKIPACKWVKLACERHNRDIAASITKGFPYVFDSAKAERACKFVSLLPHVKGAWCFFDNKAGHWNRIELQPWQCFFIASVYGWLKKSTGKRRFRKARIFVPRKNAKTAIMAALALYSLLYDNEPGAEVFCGAQSKRQAMEVFKTARQMLLKSPALVKAKNILINVESIVLPDGSKFEPVIARPRDGSSPHLCVLDEYHEANTSDLLDSFETGMGARTQPISFVISTAGSNSAGPCFTEWKHCERILEAAGGFEDDSFFAIIYTKDREDVWDDLSTAIKANPNYGVSVYEDGLQVELNAAKQSPKDQTRFKTKNLNEWTSAKDGYFNVSQWATLGKPDIKREDYADYPCYLSGDLSSKHDLTCLMQLFCLPDKRYAVFGTYWITEAALNLPQNQHYRTWHIQKRLKLAGEDIIDLEEFKSEAIEACRSYQVMEFPMDPNRAWGVMPALEREGIPVVEFRNTVLMMSEPMKELDALIRSGRIIHDGDPVLAWAIGNVTGKIDAKDNVYPRKESEANKIDPVISTLFAIGRAMTRSPELDGPLFSF